MSNLNSLAALAQTVLANDDSTYAGRSAREGAIRSFPLLAFVLIEYTYVQLSGSDYCWDSTAKGNCTLAEWVFGTVHNRHPGNSTHSFRVSAILDATYEGCDKRMVADRVQREKEAAAEEAKRAAARAARDAVAAHQAAMLTKFTPGTKVTINVKRKPVAGVVERSMKSRFDDNTVALVALATGEKKWLNVHRLTVV